MHSDFTVKDLSNTNISRSIVRLHRIQYTQMRPTATDIALCVISQCVSAAKTSEPIQMPLERGQSCVDPRNRAFSGVQNGATWRMRMNDP